MAWLAIHMWLLLLLAFAIGVGTGWWMRARPKHVAPILEPAQQGSLERDAPGEMETPPQT